MHARHYSSALGRFLSPDPLLGSRYVPPSWNRYSYVLNNPMGSTDPTGLLTERGMGPEGPGLLPWGQCANCSFRSWISDAWHTAVNWLAGGSKAENDRGQQIQQLSEDPATGGNLADETKKPSAYREGLKDAHATIVAMFTETIIVQGAVLGGFKIAGRLAEIWGDSRLFAGWLKGSQSLARVNNPLSHVEAVQVIANARRLGLTVDLNAAGLAGQEVTGQWAGIPHFEIGNVHISVQPGFTP
jgi:hypothetical protein